MSDQIDILNKKINKIEKELNNVKEELRTLNFEQKINKPKSEKIIPKAVPAVLNKNVVQENSKVNKKSKSLEQHIGDWLPRIFIFVFILGIIWAFIAASNNGWFSPVLRVVLGFALSGGLYVLGDRYYKKHKNVLGIVLLGGSIIVYTVSIFAGNVLYEFIPNILTLFLLAFGIFIGVMISRKYNSQSLLSIIGIGAYLYPFLFAGDKGNEIIFYIYETLVFLGLIIESNRKQFKITWNIAVYAFFFVVLFFLGVGAGEVTFIALLTLAAQQVVIIYLSFNNNQQINKEMYISAISSGALFMFILGKEVFATQTIPSYIFLGTMVTVYFVLCTLKGFKYNVLREIYFVASMFYLFVLISELFMIQELVKTIILTLQAYAVYYFAQKQKSILGTLGSLLILSIVALELFGIEGYNLTIYSILNWLLVIGFFVLIYKYSGFTTVFKKETIISFAPYLISILTLFFFSNVSELITDGKGNMISSIGLSASWIVFVGLMYAAYGYFKERVWNHIGLCLLLVTLIKITLFDLSTLDIVWRAILFMILGVIGLVISRVFYSKKSE